MQIDFSKEVKTINGEPIKNGENSVTLQFVCREALLGANEADKNVSGEEKYSRWQLANKCDKVVDLSVEEIATLKKLTGRQFPPVIVGPVFDMLEGKA